MAQNNLARNKSSGRDGAKYSYKYTDIAQIHEWLEENGYSYYQFIERIEGDDYIYTVPIVDGKELAPRRGCRVTDAKLVGITNPAQEQGSAITYARRYSLLMAFGLATEDDDAESLSRPKLQKREEPKAEEPKEDVIKASEMFVGKNHIATIKAEMERTGITESTICKTLGILSIEQMTIDAFTTAMAMFEKTPSVGCK